jgi:hypothetical protein
VSYNILRNGQKVAESGTTSYTDTGLSELTTYKYTVSANCKGGVLSDPSEETAAATVTTRDATPPRVTNISPFSGQTGVSTAATVTVSFNEAMDPTTINTNTFSLKVASTGANIPGTVTYATATRIATFTPSAALPSSSDITATITTGMKDLAGNALSLTTGSPGVWTFTTADFDPPRVIATSPVNGTRAASATAPITITFNEAMDATTINGSNITVRVTATGTSIAGIVTYNALTRTATFTPSAPLAIPVNYTVRIAGVKDLAGNTIATPFEFSFTAADTTPPAIVATVPVNGLNNVPLNTTVNATFSQNMDPATITAATFTLKPTAGGANVTGTVTYNAGTKTATFTPASPLTPSTGYTATVTTAATNDVGIALAANTSWTFTTTNNVAPVVQSVSPANGTTAVATNSAVNITFSKEMDASTVNNTNITLKNTNTSAAVAGTVAYNTVTHVATFTPNVALGNGTNYTLTVTTAVKDAAGIPLAAQFTSSFTTILPPPAVVSTFPADFATEVAIDTAVTVTFNHAMDLTTITSSTFTLKTTSGGTPVTGTVIYDPATFTAKFKPSSPLANNTVYTATVTTSVKDADGNPLPSDKTFSFTTTKFPTVIATSPLKSATAVPVTAQPTVTFSEAMDGTTISTTTFTLKTTSGGVAVPGTVTYDAPTKTAKFAPASNLAASTKYTVTITTGVKDTAGNAMQAPFTFDFTTAP